MALRLKSRMRSSGVPPRESLASKIEGLTLSSRAELLADQRAHPPYGTLFREPPESYVRVTSTRHGLRWLDSQASLDANARRWRAALNGVHPGDRIAWALPQPVALEALVIAIAPLNHQVRLREVREQAPAVLVCTPTDAL